MENIKFINLKDGRTFTSNHYSFDFGAKDPAELWTDCLCAWNLSTGDKEYIPKSQISTITTEPIEAP